MRPAAGSVRTQTTTMLRTTRQCTTPPARPSPAPMTPPEMTCVVESEKPKYEDARIVEEAPVWAEKPCGGWMSVTRVPSVLITRQPPEKVPAAIARGAVALTQNGIACAGPEAAARDERQRDHAHRLLRIVRAVRERDQRARWRSGRAGSRGASAPRQAPREAGTRAASRYRRRRRR